MDQVHILTSFHFDTNTKSFKAKATQRKLGFHDVLIETTHSGICFTDVHAKDKGCCLGHEGVGTVIGAGPAVKHLQVGQRVGWGWLRQSCGHCTTCVTGYRQYCAAARGFAYCDEDEGAFGDYHIIDAEFAYLIPEVIESVDAAPLMCAGASVFEALDAAGTRPGDRVGVVGVGGLGHMAILFAKAMGCNVTAISSGSKKVEDAFELGADEFRNSGNIDFIRTPGHPSLQQIRSPMNINILLVTSNAVPDLQDILPLLARRATIVLMTIQNDSIKIPYMQFILPGHRMIASTEASQKNHIGMLDFAAKHKIKPWTEVFHMSEAGLANAFKRLESGKMRYRGVCVRQT